jgi:hypothetical protein
MNIQIKKQPSSFAKVVMLLLILSPVLQCYGWGKFDFSFIIMALLSVYYIVVKGVNFKKTPGKLILYWGWWYLSHLISSSIAGDIFHLGIIRIAITYLMYIDMFEIEYFMSKYKTVASIVIGYFYIQEFSRIVFGVTLLPVAEFLPLAIMDDAQEYYSLTLESVRSSSFFKEPAVFAQFLLPLLCYELFGKTKKDVKYILLVFITLLWSRSGNAIVGILAIGVCYIFGILVNKYNTKTRLYVILGAVVAIIISSFFLKTEDGRNILERADTIDAESTIDRGYASSTFLRVYQGYFIFTEYSPFYKIVGNDHESYIQQQAFQSPVISALYSNSKREYRPYFNSFQSALIFTGIVGLLILIALLMEVWKGNTFCGKSLLFLLIALSLVSSNFFTTTMAYFLVPAIALKQKNSKKVLNTGLNTK